MAIGTRDISIVGTFEARDVGCTPLCTCSPLLSNRVIWKEVCDGCFKLIAFAIFAAVCLINC